MWRDECHWQNIDAVEYLVLVMPTWNCQNVIDKQKSLMQPSKGKYALILVFYENVKSIWSTFNEQMTLLSHSHVTNNNNCACSVHWCMLKSTYLGISPQSDGVTAWKESSHKLPTFDARSASRTNYNVALAQRQLSSHQNVPFSLTMSVFDFFVAVHICSIADNTLL